MRPDHPAPALSSAPPPLPSPRPSPCLVRGLAAALTLLLGLAPTSAAADVGASATTSFPRTRAAAAGTAAGAAAGSAAPAGQTYVLPLPGLAAMTGRSREDLDQIVLHAFVDPGPAWGAGHRGVDLGASQASAALAPAAGTVTFVGVVVDRPLMVITHPDGLRSTLEPVVAGLAPGTRVEAGEAVGELAPEASTHCAPAHCLHWGVRRGEEYLDPLLLLGLAEAVVLLPLR